MREASYPPPYPDGWYRVAATRELRPGVLKYIECLGRQLVVYRSEDGKSVHAISAFCPHMGANLGGGCVRGKRVECPFHSWQICSDGAIGHIPYSDKIPAGTRQQTFPIREHYGQVFVYHRGGGSPSRFDDLPPYEIPALPEVDDGRFVYRGHHDAGRVHMHLIEFAENSVDFAHFAPIHGQMKLPWTNIRIPGIEIEHEADWRLDPDQPHVAYFLDRAVLRVFGRKIERTGANAVIKFIGPGSVVFFRFDIPDIGEIVMFQTHLPVTPLEQQVDFHWLADKKIPRLLVSYVIGNWVSQWRQDIDIWENKIYLERPLLAKGDGPVHGMRRWYRQFYPDHPSPVSAPSAPERETGRAIAVPPQPPSLIDRPMPAEGG
jgi:cholesterol 7-dehydrogenase